MLEDDTSMTDADIYITPPLDPNCSDEDSGGEDEGTMSNLTLQQLQAEAEVTVRHGAEKIRISNEIDSADQISDQPAVLPTSAAPDQSANESAVPSTKPRRLVRPPSRFRESSESGGLANPANMTPPSEKRTVKRPAAKTSPMEYGDEYEEDQPKSKKRPTDKPARKWSKKDTPAERRPSDVTTANDYVNSDYTFTKIFELFFDDTVVSLLVENTIKYAHTKGKHSFHVTPDKTETLLCYFIY